MKLLSIYRHYWPDTTPYARLLRAILEARVEAGDEAEAYTGQPSYNDYRTELQPRRESLGGVEVRRFRLPPGRKAQRLLRGMSFGYFLARSALPVLGGRAPDLLLVNCHPPVAMGLLMRLLERLRGVPFVYHCQDIHPEALLLGGRLGEGRLYRFLRRADTATCERAAAVVVLSEDMRQTMLERGVSVERLVVINNFPLDEYAQDGPVADPVGERVPEGAFVVLFAGNLGNFQGLDALVEAARLLEHLPDLHLIFMGSGLARERLEAQAGALCGRSIHFLGQHSVEVARAAMARSHLGIVSLTPGVAKVAYPSKLMTYVASGCPVLALVEDDSSVAADVREADLGRVCADHRPEAIAAEIEKAYADRARWDDEGREALRTRADALFGRAAALEKWATLFDRLASAGKAP